ncbi:MAG: hypothetical protein KDA98_17890, partial [Acidimicrobiales bacterium]|nr:hypothetical protein [Acidimicrobiales bacterium]
ARTPIPGRDRALAAWMDPRGVVAAATAAQFTPTLDDLGLDASLMLPLVFGTILGVGFVYGLSGPLVARALGVTAPRPHGVALVGDRPWLLDLGCALRDLGVEVLVVATDRVEEPAARHAALPSVSVLDSERELHEHLSEAPLASAVLALEHAAVVSLVGAELVEELGRSHVYVTRTRGEGSVERALEAWAPAPFAPGTTLSELDRRAAAGARVRACPDGVPADAIALAVVHLDGSVDLRPGRRGRRRPRTDGTPIALVG